MMDYRKGRGRKKSNSKAKTPRADTKDDTIDSTDVKQSGSAVQFLENLEEALDFNDKGAEGLVQRLITNPQEFNSSLTDGQVVHLTRTLFEFHETAYTQLTQLLEEAKNLRKTTSPEENIESEDWFIKAKHALSQCKMSSSQFESKFSVASSGNSTKDSNRNNKRKRNRSHMASDADESDAGAALLAAEEESSFDAASMADHVVVDYARVVDFWKMVVGYMQTPQIDDLKRLKKDAIMSSKFQLVIPPLGSMSSEPNSKKKKKQKISTPKASISKGQRGEIVELPTQVSADDVTMLHALHDALKESGCAPSVAAHTVAQRLLSAFVSPPDVKLYHPSQQQFPPASAHPFIPDHMKPETPKTKKSSVKQSKRTLNIDLSDRVKMELSSLDMPVASSQIDKDLDALNRQDDEVCAEIRMYQKQLEAQIDMNNKRRQKLYALSFKINDRSKYLRQLDEAEYRLNEIWARKELQCYSNTKQNMNVSRMNVGAKVTDHEVQEAVTARDTILSKVRSRSELTGFFVDWKESAGIPRVELNNYQNRCAPSGVNPYQYHFDKLPSHLFPPSVKTPKSSYSQQ